MKHLSKTKEFLYVQFSGKTANVEASTKLVHLKVRVTHAAASSKSTVTHVLASSETML